MVKGDYVVPSLSFTPVGTRSLIVLNNPEQLFATELADSSYSQTAVLVVDDIQGDSREWFELFNRAGVTVGFAVVIQNTMTNGLNITVTGLRQGWVTDWIQGPPLASMFNTDPDYDTKYELRPGEFLPIMKEDGSVANNTAFSGAVDFTITGGPARVISIIYVDWDDVQLDELVYDGYVTRVEANGELESHVYKGYVSSAVMAANNLDFVLDNTLKYPAVLPVSYGYYDLSVGQYETAETRLNFTTNITPFADPTAVASDMEAIWTPGWGLISPITQSDATYQYPNFGNWGIVLQINGRLQNALSNEGSGVVNVSFSMQTAKECLTNIAYIDAEGVWKSAASQGEYPILYFNITVPSATTIEYSAQYILGGSSCGNLVTTILASLIS